MHKQMLKKKLADLSRMDLQKLLAEMVEEMDECGTQRMSVAFLNENQKPVAAMVLLADTDVTPYLEAVQRVESSVPEEVTVTDEMALAGMQEWDKQHAAGERDWPGMLKKVFTAMHRAIPTSAGVQQ